MSKRVKRFLFIGVFSVIILANVGILIFVSLRENAHRKTNTEENTVIRVWTKDRHDAEFWKQKVDDFNRSNDAGITVEYEVFYDNYTQAVENAFATNEAPDLLVYTQTIFQSMQEQYADMTPLMDDSFRDDFSDAFFPGLNVIDGKCYYIPTAATTVRLFYNKRVFEKAGITRLPKTMEDLIETAGSINKRLGAQGTYGFAINLKTADAALNRSLYKQGSLQLGLKAGYDFETGAYDFVRYQPLVQQWRTLLSEECAYPHCDSLSIGPLRQLFMEDRIGMYMSYTHSEIGAYISEESMQDAWGCLALPTTAGRVQGTENYSLNNGYLFNKNSEDLEKTWIVYRSIFADLDNLREYYEKGYAVTFLSSLQGMTEEPAIIRDNPIMKLTASDQLWPLAPLEYNGAENSVAGAKRDEVFRELILGQGDIAGELKKLSERYNEAYREAVQEKRVDKLQIEGFDPFHPMKGSAEGAYGDR